MLPGVGPKTLAKLHRLGIYTLSDLLYHFPHRYLDFSHTIPISQATPDSFVTLTGKITKFQNLYTKTHKNLQIATLEDHTGTINLAWFNQPYLATVFKPNATFSVAGKISFFNHQKTIFSPEYGQYSTGKIISVYPETKSLTSKWFRKIIHTHITTLLSSITDPLPPNITQKYHLLSLTQALTQIHLPQDQNYLQQARTRLAIDEILSILAESELLKVKQQSLPPKPLKLYPISPVTKLLPFQLSPSQKQAWYEIRKDLTSTHHLTNRLLVGDVSSGKTLLAILSSYLTYKNNHNSLIIAPTNILAQQHFKNFKKYLPKIPIKLLTSRHHIKKFPKVSIIIATHAAFHHSKLPSITLLVVDEQHKFGVAQRSFLSSLSPNNIPHQITMSATPIPRTISLTLMGHLQLSQLQPLPHHHPPKTFLVPNNKTLSCYHWLEKQIITTQSQAFIVCPFIATSETQSSIKSAIQEFNHLSTVVFPHLKLALLHGKTKSNIRDEIIKKFQSNKIQILVTTPIIEVGVDIKNANTIIIQSAERFGLSQLHQLRGRVGRGEESSFCYLFTESTNINTISRLKFFTQNTDSQTIADYDLKTRGPGLITSNLQHGFPALKIADLANFKLIRYCQQILANILQQNSSFDPSKLRHNPAASIGHTTN